MSADPDERRKPTAARPLVAEAMSDLPARLREARMDRGHSLQSWADHLTGLGYPIHKSRVQAYENGSDVPHVAYVLAVHLVARRSLEWLMKGRGDS